MLKYLFEVEYKDGTRFQQFQDDVSQRDSSRSAFFDVKQDQVKTFSLVGEGHRYLVDLIDGHFEIDGVQFQMHEAELTDFRLIFWRRHTHTINARMKELAHEVVYRVGWQATKDGKNYQEVLQIN